MFRGAPSAAPFSLPSNLANMGQKTPTDPGDAFTKRVLVVEDQPLIRHSLVTTLETSSFEVAHAPDASSAIDLFNSFDPDGLVIDVDLGEGPSGLDLLDALRARNPVVPAVILTRLSDPRLAGASLKTESTTAFINKQLLSDPSRVASALSAVIAGLGGEGFRDDIASGKPKLSLTDTQIDILELVANGLTNEQIAEERGISARAVQRTVARALLVLGIEAQPGQDPRVLAARAYMAAIGLLPQVAASNQDST